MIKYVESLIGFREIPDEISLCINISNCPNNCPHCHSSYLKLDIGNILDYNELDYLILNNHGISCVCFMGGDRNPEDIDLLAKYVKQNYNLKTAWYSGIEFDDIYPIVKVNQINFDYIKLGPYKEDFGPLDSKKTNQRLYKNIDYNSQIHELTGWKNITDKFWK